MTVADKSSIWFAVVNGYAASSKAVHAWVKVEACLKSKGIIYHGNRTGKSGNAMEIPFDACMAGYRRFIAVGGDGTFLRAVQKHRNRLDKIKFICPLLTDLK